MSGRDRLEVDRPIRRKRAPRAIRLAAVLIRKRLGRWNRFAPEWVHWLTPWLSSLAAHGLALLALGLIYVATASPTTSRALEGQILPLDAITSGDPSDHAGDSLTTLESPEMPSLTLDPAKADADRSNIPELPPDFKLSPDIQLAPSGLALPTPSTKAAKSKSGSGSAVSEAGFAPGPETKVPFSGRRADMKARILRKEGGSVESEKAVEAGLDWLARHQRTDGGWSLDTSGQCDPKLGGCPPRIAMDSDVGATGLALLPMLAAGHTHTEKGRYQQTLRLGLKWLLKTQDRDGLFSVGGGPIATIYAHCIATMVLCEAYGLSGDKRLRDSAQRGINYLVKTQNRDDGGWRYFPGMPGDTSVFGWALFALRSASLAGLDVPRTAIRRCRVYLNLAAADEIGATYAYLPGRPATPTMTAEGLLGRQYLGWPREHPAMLQGTSILVADLQQSPARNMYYWYYVTQLLHNLQGKDWEHWNLFVRDTLVAQQVVGKGCDHGSWDPLFPDPDRNGHNAGRLYQTSLSLLTLEVYYRYLPLYQLRNEGMLAGDAVDAPAARTEVEEPKAKTERKTERPALKKR